MPKSSTKNSPKKSVTKHDTSDGGWLNRLGGALKFCAKKVIRLPGGILRLAKPLTLLTLTAVALFHKDARAHAQETGLSQPSLLPDGVWPPIPEFLSIDALKRFEEVGDKAELKGTVDEASKPPTDRIANKKDSGSAITNVNFTPMMPAYPLLELEKDIASLAPHYLEIYFDEPSGRFESFSQTYAHGSQVNPGVFEITIFNSKVFKNHLKKVIFLPTCDLQQNLDFDIKFDNDNKTRRQLSFQTKGPFFFKLLQENIEMGSILDRGLAQLNVSQLIQTNYNTLVHLDSRNKPSFIALTDQQQHLTVDLSQLHLQSPQKPVAFSWSVPCAPSAVAPTNGTFLIPATLRYDRAMSIQLTPPTHHTYGALVKPLIHSRGIDSSHNATLHFKIPDGWRVYTSNGTESNHLLNNTNTFHWHASFEEMNRTRLAICPTSVSSFLTAPIHAHLDIQPIWPLQITSRWDVSTRFFFNSFFKFPNKIWTNTLVKTHTINRGYPISQLMLRANTSLLDVALLQSTALSLFASTPLDRSPYRISLVDSLTGCTLFEKVSWSGQALPMVGYINAYDKLQRSTQSNITKTIYLNHPVKLLKHLVLESPDNRLAHVAMQIFSMDFAYCDQNGRAVDKVRKEVYGSFIGYNLKELNAFFNKKVFFLTATNHSNQATHIMISSRIGFLRQPTTASLVFLGNASLTLSPPPYGPISEQPINAVIRPFGFSKYELCFDRRWVDLNSVRLKQYNRNSAIDPDGYLDADYIPLRFDDSPRIAEIQNKTHQLCVLFAVGPRDSYTIEYTYKLLGQPKEMQGKRGTILFGATGRTYLSDFLSLISAGQLFFSLVHTLILQFEVPRVSDANKDVFFKSLKENNLNAFLDVSTWNFSRKNKPETLLFQFKDNANLFCLIAKYLSFYDHIYIYLSALKEQEYEILDMIGEMIYQKFLAQKTVSKDLIKTIIIGDDQKRPFAECLRCLLLLDFIVGRHANKPWLETKMIKDILATSFPTVVSHSVTINQAKKHDKLLRANMIKSDYGAILVHGIITLITNVSIFSSKPTTIDWLPYVFFQQFFQTGIPTAGLHILTSWIRKKRLHVEIRCDLSVFLDQLNTLTEMANNQLGTVETLSNLIVEDKDKKYRYGSTFAGGAVNHLNLQSVRWGEPDEGQDSRSQNEDHKDTPEEGLEMTRFNRRSSIFHPSLSSSAAAPIATQNTPLLGT